jgi:hypothetical protein
LAMIWSVGWAWMTKTPNKLSLACRINGDTALRVL